MSIERRTAASRFLVFGILIATGFTAPGAGRASHAAADSPRWDVSQHKVNCEGRDYRYLLYAPAHENEHRTADGESGPRPALLLLHGAHGEPEPMVEAWKKLASLQGIVLLAPEIPSVAWFEAQAPAVFRCEAQDAEKFAPIDAARISVFGYSMGGYLAYDAAMYDSEFFAAVVVTSMGIDKDYDGILTEAKRKIPLAIYMGDRDPAVDVRSVRRTAEILKQNGFPVHYVEIKGHDHNYFAASEQINEDAWNFLRDKVLN